MLIIRFILPCIIRLLLALWFTSCCKTLPPVVSSVAKYSCRICKQQVQLDDTVFFTIFFPLALAPGGGSPPSYKHKILPIYIPPCRLRHNPLWVSGEQAAHANVRQTQPELNNSLQAKASSCVGWTAVSETIDVILGTRTVRVDRWIVFAHLFGEQLGVMNSLSTRADLLSAHEHVVGVGKLGVVGRGHCVCRANCKRELVKDIEVRVVLLEDQATEVLFLRCSTVYQFCFTILGIASTYVKSS